MDGLMPLSMVLTQLLKTETDILRVALYVATVLKTYSIFSFEIYYVLWIKYLYSFIPMVYVTKWMVKCVCKYKTLFGTSNIVANVGSLDFVWSDSRY